MAQASPHTGEQGLPGARDVRVLVRDRAVWPTRRRPAAAPRHASPSPRRAGVRIVCRGGGKSPRVRCAHFAAGITRRDCRIGCLGIAPASGPSCIRYRISPFDRVRKSLSPARDGLSSRQRDSWPRCGSLANATTPVDRGGRRCMALMSILPYLAPADIAAVAFGPSVGAPRAGCDSGRRSSSSGGWWAGSGRAVRVGHRAGRRPSAKCVGPSENRCP